MEVVTTEMDHVTVTPGTQENLATYVSWIAQPKEDITIIILY